MDQIKDCLPTPEANKHFLHLRNRSLQSSNESHRQTLNLMRATFAHTGTLGSGRQIAQEWRLTEDKIDSLAKDYLDDALKTIDLYRIPLTQQLCDCLEQALRHMLETSYAHEKATLRGALTAQPVPEGLDVQLGSRMDQGRFKAMTDISIRLTESRLAYERQGEQRVSESDAKGHTYNIQNNTVHQGGTINASQTGDVHAQTLTVNDFDAIAAYLAEVRSELRKREPTVETDEYIGYLAAAERAAKEKDESKMLGCLKQVGSKLWDLTKVVAPQALLLYAKYKGIG